jgi:hypothetical protein
VERPDFLAGRRSEENLPLPARQATDINRAERIQAILSSKGLSLYQISQQTAAMFSRSSPFFIPHNLYHDLRDEGFAPSIFQVYALSQISGYRLVDWLHVFGIDLEDIPRLQVLLPRKRTMLIDAALTDTQAWAEWFRSRTSKGESPRIAPLAQLLENVGPSRISSLPGDGTNKFTYAKVGTDDALAFPELLPGSIVRINPQPSPDLVQATNGVISHHLFLLEHGKGLFCNRVRWIGDRVIPVSTNLSFAQVEMRVPAEARILGVVDLEFRSLLEGPVPKVPLQLAKLWKPLPLKERKNFGQLISQARLDASLSFRESEALSRRISDANKDERYRISSTSLCDYEIEGTPPRSLHKVITLCCVYGIAFRSLLLSIGIPIEQTGKDAMPDHLVGRTSPGTSLARSDESPTGSSGFVEGMIEEYQEIPFFLRNSVASLTGLRNTSVNDFFWIGGELEPLHPYFANGLLAVVNRRRKTPFHFPAKPLWKQPVYLLLRRDGEYLCACCHVENGTLVIHPHTDNFSGVSQFR